MYTHPRLSTELHRNHAAAADHVRNGASAIVRQTCLGALMVTYLNAPIAEYYMQLGHACLLPAAAQVAGEPPTGMHDAASTPWRVCNCILNVGTPKLWRGPVWRGVIVRASCMTTQRAASAPCPSRPQQGSQQEKKEGKRCPSSARTPAKPARCQCHCQSQPRLGCWTERTLGARANTSDMPYIVSY
jgi:hypothetical protein